MIFDILITAGIVLSAVILHECAHGWVAYKRGDPTAKLAGRLTLNPLKHIDPFGTVILPAVLLFLRFLGMHIFVFGWAKPVPVNFQLLRNPRWDMIWVALAGPAVNIAIAIFCSFLLNYLIRASVPFKYFDLVVLAMYVNILLAVFNMMPIPPLDGSRVVMGLLPRPLGYFYSRLERYGILIIIVFLNVGLYNRIVFPLVQFMGRVLGVEFS